MATRSRRPTPSRPSKRTGSVSRCTPRRPEHLDMSLSLSNDDTLQQQGNEQNEFACTTTEPAMDLLATLAADQGSSAMTAAPYSPPRFQLNRVLDASASTTDPSVLSPRKAISLEAPTSPVPAYSVPESFQVKRTGGLVEDSDSHSPKRRRSFEGKENDHTNRGTVSRLFPSTHFFPENPETAAETERKTRPYEWNVNILSLSPCKKQEFYWNECYGGAVAVSSAQEVTSWSARREPPAKGCISTGPKKRQSIKLVNDSNASQLSPSPQATRVADTFSTPKSSPMERAAALLTDSQNRNRTVQFGLPHAVEFDSDHPAGSLTPMPDQVAAQRFPIEKYQDEEPSELIQETKDNTAELAAWEFGVFEDDDDMEESFQLPDPPSHRRGRRNSGFFSPSEGSASLLDDSDDEQESMYMGAVHDEDDFVLDMPGLASLSVHSPRADRMLQHVHSSGAAVPPPKETDETSPDCVRVVDAATMHRDSVEPCEGTNADASLDDQSAIDTGGALNIWEAFRLNGSLKPEEWSNSVVFESLAGCDTTLLSSVLENTLAVADQKPKDDAPHARMITAAASIKPVKQALEVCLGRLESYTAMLEIQVPDALDLEGASVLPSGLVLNDRSRQVAEHDFAKANVNICKVVKAYMDSTLVGLQAEEKRLDDAALMPKRLQNILTTRNIARLEDEIKGLEGALAAATLSKARSENAKLRHELDSIPTAALIDQLLKMCLPFNVVLSGDGYNFEAVYEHCVEGMQSHIQCNLSGDRFTGRIESSAVCHHRRGKPTIFKTPESQFAFDFHGMLLQPLLDHHCAKGKILPLEPDLDSKLWHVGAVLGRLDLATEDLAKIAHRNPWISCADNHVVVSLALGSEFIVVVVYNPTSLCCLEMCLPDYVVLCDSDGERVADQPAAIDAINALRGPGATASLYHTAIERLMVSLEEGAVVGPDPIHFVSV